MINNNELNELKILSDKIRYNTANIDDYKRYEELLLKGGFTKERLNNKIQNISSWDKFLYDRKFATTPKDIENINKSLILILSLGGAILLYHAFNKRRKKK